MQILLQWRPMHKQSTSPIQAATGWYCLCHPWDCTRYHYSGHRLSGPMVHFIPNPAIGKHPCSLVWLFVAVWIRSLTRRNVACYLLWTPIASGISIGASSKKFQESQRFLSFRSKNTLLLARRSNSQVGIGTSGTKRFDCFPIVSLYLSCPGKMRRRN